MDSTADHAALLPLQAIPEIEAARDLLLAHPTLTADSVDVADTAGLGRAALINVHDMGSLRDWALALGLKVRNTRLSNYGTTEPKQQGLPDWLWWRLLWIDTHVNDTPVRLWTLQASRHARTLAAQIPAGQPH
ncbi:hypothetical protein [Streptomyces sasae]|uniref:hypothetical protein n=1 Tax=Streptomyces sasae TaxID=1266772 RepID=UPI00292F6706|nr:hypothetical protein [Streptomyces sasae]